MFPHSTTEDRIYLGEKPLEYTVYSAESIIAKAVGLMGRPGIPKNTALLFDMGRPSQQPVHMLGVREPIRVWWVTNNRIKRTEQLKPWSGFAMDRGDTIIELPADAPPGSIGQRVSIE